MCPLSLAFKWPCTSGINQKSWVWAVSVYYCWFWQEGATIVLQISSLKERFSLGSSLYNAKGMQIPHHLHLKQTTWIQKRKILVKYTKTGFEGCRFIRHFLQKLVHSHLIPMSLNSQVKPLFNFLKCEKKKTHLERLKWLYANLNS